MTRPQAIIGRQRDEVIGDAAYRKTQIVLTRRAQDRWETYKSRLLDMASARRALVVAYPHEAGDDASAFARGEQVGVAFRHHSRKCLFASTVVGKSSPKRNRARPHACPSLLLSWPEQIEQMQRRAYYRVPVPRESPISVRFWPGGPPPGSPTPPDQPVAGQLLDLSVGGMLVEVAAADDPRLCENDPVRAEFAPESHQPSIAIEACYRHTRPLDRDKRALGFQFIGLELTDNGPSLLARLARAVSRLQQCQDFPRA